MFDPKLNNTQAGTMRAIQLIVSQGYYWFVCGFVPLLKVQLLVQKMDERYQLQMTQGQRDHARRKKIATFRLILWPVPDQTSFYWILLRTEGEHPLLAMETWLDARGPDRIQWPWLYELVRTPVPKALRAKYKRKDGRHAINPVTWTWRIRPMEVERLKALIRHIVHTRDDRLRQVVRGLAISPGLRGVRDDVYGLFRYIEKRCATHHRTDVTVPMKIFPIRSKVGRLIPLSVVLHRARKGKESWFPDVKIEACRPEVAVLSQPDTAKAETTKE